jgi:radical SAM protein with 4Fe4S-binding SPASM domain
MLTAKAFDFFVQWHLTERCNLRCRHCYQEGQSHDELSLTEILRTIDEIAEMITTWSDSYGVSFSPSFTVTGGEPFLRDDLFGILEAMRQKGFDLFLLSNGILINQEKAEGLSKLGIKGVQVSLEGPEYVHESIRGKGSFSASIKGIGYLVTAGIQVTLNMTLSKLNAGFILPMADLTKALGVDRLGFSRLVPSGRGTALIDQALSREEIRDLYRQIFPGGIEGLQIVTGDPIASQMNEPEVEEDLGSIPLAGCAAGFSGLTLLPDGTVLPCRRMPVPIGNVKKDSLRELWVSSPVLEDLRNKKKYQGKCGRCKRWAACRGCRAIAYAYASARGKKNFLAEDPHCFLI